MEKLRSAVVKTVSEQPEPCSQFLAPWESESGPLTPPAMPTKAVADFQSGHHHREGVRPTKHAPENGPKSPCVILTMASSKLLFKSTGPSGL